jgi:hypothetical protein
MYMVIHGLTWPYMAIYGKWDFEDVINLCILTWKDYPRFSCWAQCNPKAFKWKETHRRVGEGDVIPEKRRKRETIRQTESWWSGSNGSAPA